MLLSDVCMSDVCLSVAYIGPKSRTERPRNRNTKIGTEVAHVTRDLDTKFKVKRSKVKVTRPLDSPSCLRVRQLQRWAWERVGREKLLLRCRLLGRESRFGAHGGGEGAYRGGRPTTACLLLLVCSSQFGVTVNQLANINKQVAYSHQYNAIWLSGIDVSTVTQLLDVKHNYACLPLFSSDEIDFMIEYLCTN